MNRAQSLCSACSAVIASPGGSCWACGATPPVEPRGGQQSEAAGREPERRFVTISFADLVESTALADGRDAEEVQEILAAVQRAFDRMVHEYGGHVAKDLGDGIMALFGVPIAHGDDAERAVLAGLGMQQALELLAEYEIEWADRSPVPLKARVGIASGVVVVTPTGFRYDVTGDAANTAARLQAAAPVGGVLVAEDTMRLAQRRVRFGERTLLELKGKAQPVPAYVALGRREQPIGRWETRHRTVPLVGRSEALAQLLAAFEQARQGHGQLVTIIGEAGLGKSRLCHEFLSQVAAREPVQLLRGHCVGYGSMVSLWPLAEMLRLFCGLRETDAAEVRRASLTAQLGPLLAQQHPRTATIDLEILGAVLGLPPLQPTVAAAEPEARWRMLVAACDHLLAGLSERAVTILLLEDLQWADAASLRLLGRLLEATPQRRMLALITQRPAETMPWPEWGWVQRLELRPLDRRQIRELTALLLEHRAVAPDAEDYLFQRTEGNPLFLEELTHTLWASGSLGSAEGQVRLLDLKAIPLPWSLAEALVARLDRLDGAARSCAQVASVIGTQFTSAILAHVLQCEVTACATLLTALQRAQIVRDDTGDAWSFAFAHTALREVIYGTLLRRRRQALHRLVARAFIEVCAPDPHAEVTGYQMPHEHAEIIAHHFAQGSEQQHAAEWLERAGDRAVAVGASAVALIHYASAYEHIENGPVPDPRALSRLNEKLGDLRLLTGDLAAAQDHFARARVQEPEPIRRADLQRKEASTWIQRGDYVRALAELALAEAEAGAGDGVPQLHATIAISRGDVLWRRGEYQAAEAEGRRALALLPQRGPAMLRARAFHLLGNIACSRCEYPEAERWHRQSLTLRQQEGDPWAIAVSWNDLGEVARARGDYTTAAHCYHQAMPMWERIGDQWGAAVGATNLGEIAVLQGDYAQAEQHFRRSLVLWERGRYQIGIATCWYNLGKIALAHGEWSAARRWFGQGRRLARRIGVLEIEAACLLALAVVCDQHGHRSLARGVLARGATLAGDHTLMKITLYARLWHAIQQCHDAGATAYAAAREALALALQAQMKREEALAHQVLAYVLAAHGSLAEAREHGRSALALFQTLDGKGDVAYAQVALADLLAASPSDVAEAAHLREAAQAALTARGLRTEHACWSVMLP